MAPSVAWNPEVWQVDYWNFRLHVLSPARQSGDCATMQGLMKSHILARVVPIVARADVTGQGFAMAGLSSSGLLRIQACWWTRHFALHRDAVQGAVSTYCFEPLPPWEFGTAEEVAVIAREITAIGRC